MQNLTNFAAFEEAPEQILSALQNREKLPYFHTELELSKPPLEVILKNLFGSQKRTPEQAKTLMDVLRYWLARQFQGRAEGN